MSQCFSLKHKICLKKEWRSHSFLFSSNSAKGVTIYWYMHSFVRLGIDIVIVVTIFGVVFFLYQTYGQQLVDEVFGEQKISIFISDIPIVVTVADTPEKHQRGLSHVESLDEKEGMLFIFPKEGKYGFWMKDTLIPLDIIWINNDMEVVHIERNVRPESYPTIYHSPVPARFVVEANAFFASTFSLKVGDKVIIPANRLPADLK